MKKNIIPIVFILFSVISYANNIEFSASAPSKVGLNQSFQLTYTIKNANVSPNLPDIQNFNIVSGPSISTSQSTRIINNNVTSETTRTYTYRVQPRSLGTFTIAPANIVVNGNTYKSNSLQVEVVEENVAEPSRPQQPRHGQQHQHTPQQRQEPQTAQITDEDVFIRVDVNKTNVYRGEHLRARVKMYSKYDVAALEDFVPPAYNSFWSESIEMPGRIHLDRKIINNQVYNYGEIQKYILFPRHSGELKIEPAELTLQLRQIVRGGESLLEQFFGQQQVSSKTIRSPEVIINVKELPRNHSEHFTGAVGDYKFELNLNRDTILVNEAVSLELKVSGNGNLRMLNAPKIEFPTEFEVYDPDISNNFSAKDHGVTGSKTWDYTIIPRYPGVYNLGNVVFEYFDPAKSKFKTIRSRPVIIAVKQHEGDETFSQTFHGTSQRRIDYINEKDIRFIKTGNLNLKQSSNPLITSWKIPAFYIVAIVAFMVIVVLKRKKIKENRNLVHVKNKRASKISKKRMKTARKFMIADQQNEFYKEVINTIWGYLGDKLNIDASELNREQVKTKLTELNIEDDIVTRLLNLIDTCEFAHFAHEKSDVKTSDIYDNAFELIKILEQKLKR